MTGALMAAQFQLRRAGLDCARDIAGVQSSFFDAAWNETAIADLLAQPAARALVLDEKPPGALAGFIIGMIAADEAEILLLGVVPPLRRRGLACRLVLAFAESARGEGAIRLLLEVAADNRVALGLYRKLGFAEVGTRRDYYQRAGARPVAALQLAKSL